eukprot:5446655-Prymnesium_polylepis.1
MKPRQSMLCLLRPAGAARGGRYWGDFRDRAAVVKGALGRSARPPRRRACSPWNQNSTRQTRVQARRLSRLC